MCFCGSLLMNLMWFVWKLLLLGLNVFCDFRKGLSSGCVVWLGLL